MKKHKDVKNILRENGISGVNNLDYVQVIGGYFETFVMYKSGATTSVVNADSNQPDNVTLVTTNPATVTVADSGETYFFISGITTSVVNGIEISKTNNVVSISGSTVNPGDTKGAGDGTYFTFLGDGVLGMGWRLLDLNSTGETEIVMSSIEVSGTTTMTSGDTQNLSVIGTYSNGNTTDVTDDVKYTSSDDTIATLTRKGKVSALKAGSVTITATYNDPLTSTTLTDTFDITIS